MTKQELDNLYLERINRLAPYIRTIPEDMAQEARIGVFQALKKDPGANNAYLKQGARWRIGSAMRRGKSVDNGYWRRDQVEMIPYDECTDGVFSFIFKNRMDIPLDDLVNDKMELEDFFALLTPHEKDFIEFKLDGWSNNRIMEELHMSSYSRLQEMKDNIRFKIDQTFMEGGDTDV